MNIVERAERVLAAYQDACTADDARDASFEIRTCTRLLVAEVMELRRNNAALRTFIAPSLKEV